jgi:methylglutamate dehydrogenase subunit D
MAEAALRRRSAFDGLAPGAPSKNAGLRALRRDGLALANVIARKEQTSTLRRRIKDSLGLDLPNGSSCVRNGEFSAIGTAPGAWLIAAEAAKAAGFVDDLTRTLDGAAAVIDQSGAYQVLRLSGQALRDVLAKGVALDFHPEAFPSGGAAVTLADHVNIILWRVDSGEALTLDMAAPRSVFGDFWSWLTESAAAYGLALDDPPATMVEGRIG